MNDLVEALLREKRRHGLAEVCSPREKTLLDSGMPVQKILGFTEFAGVKISLKRKVFIPRYETEEVVLECLKHLKPGAKVLDLCAGSGFIGLALKKARPSIELTLSDKSTTAVKAMQENAILNGVRAKIVQGNLFENIKGKFDLIVSNPPYLLSSDQLSPSVLNFEPRSALFGGQDGNKFYRAILKQITPFLNPGAVVVFELGPNNAPYLKAQGFTVLKDLNGKDRIAYRVY